MVYALHRHQVMEVELNADRNIPLPLLKTDRQPDFNLDEEKSASQVVSQRRVQKQPKLVHWQDKVTALQNAGELEGAYSVCQRAFPLWSAYSKAIVLLRMKIRKLAKEQHSITAELDSLFRLAAVAELLHDKTTPNLALDKKQMKQLDLSLLNGLEMSYPELGYKFLRLIKQTDIKLMTEQWGEPKHHLLPRELHKNFWQELLNSGAAGK
jgi:hypothetical protein|tara:strand:- start:5859 stop:6488 length:630 start_codon:yes stop_codon:yes gene_type:complete